MAEPSDLITRFGDLDAMSQIVRHLVETCPNPKEGGFQEKMDRWIEDLFERCEVHNHPRVNEWYKLFVHIIGDPSYNCVRCENFVIAFIRAADLLLEQ